MNRKETLRGSLCKSLKKRLVKSLIWSVALYGAETWTLRKEDERRLEAFEMWVWRRRNGQREGGKRKCWIWLARRGSF